MTTTPAARSAPPYEGPPATPSAGPPATASTPEAASPAITATPRAAQSARTHRAEAKTPPAPGTVSPVGATPSGTSAGHPATASTPEATPEAAAAAAGNAATRRSGAEPSPTAPRGTTIPTYNSAAPREDTARTETAATVGGTTVRRPGTASTREVTPAGHAAARRPGAEPSRAPTRADAAGRGGAAAPALRVEGLGVAYQRRAGRSGSAAVLSGVELEVTAGQILGVIGETGSGKTTLARAVVGLAPVVAGRIGVAGVEVGALRGRELREHRRSGLVQYMFQDPLRSLDPDLTVNDLVGEPLAVAGVERAERRERVAEALHRVGLSADTHGDRIPAQLSGGQRQRVSLARAIVTRPALLLADEPVSALDASNRNHVLRLLDELRRDLGVAVVVISHDLSSLAGIADRIAVLYRGRLVEQGPTTDVLAHPLHPYTALLTASAPRVDRDPTKRRERPGPPGAVPGWAADPGACVFAHRCPLADADCRTQPGSSPHPGERAAACHHPVIAAH